MKAKIKLLSNTTQEIEKWFYVNTACNMVLWLLWFYVNMLLHQHVNSFM